MFTKSHTAALLGPLLTLLACHAEPAIPADPVMRARQRLASTPRDPAIHLELAGLALGQQDYLRAMQYLNLAERAELSPAQRDEVFHMALAIAVRGHNYDDAIRRTQQELQTRESLELRRLLALLLEAHGSLRDAECQHLLITELYPDAVDQLTQAARFYDRSSLPDHLIRAREFYERYLKAAPAGPESAQARAALILNRHIAQQSH